MTDKVICSECGAEIFAESKFCSKCGIRQSCCEIQQYKKTNKDVSEKTKSTTGEITEKQNPNEKKMDSNILQKKTRTSMLNVLIFFTLLAIILVSSAVILRGSGIGGNLMNSQKIAVIYVQGTMVTDDIPTGLGYAASEKISQNIRNAAADKNVKAIVLRIDSPGGSPAAAQEIVDEIKKAQAHGVPVVVSMGNTAASAAYYISAPANYIIANPSTVTGSIGVIWVFQNMSTSYLQNGTNYQIIKSGEMKDMGSPWRGLTDEEKEYANTVVMEIYDEFISEVSKGRNMPISNVKALADGRIYTGTRAKQLKLVDNLGDLYDAIDKAAELGGIKGEPKVEYMNRASPSNLLLCSASGQSNKIQ